MAILVLSNPLPSAPFAEALRHAAPDVPIWTEADAPDPGQVEAILAWRMKAGILPKYPNLRVLCSTGAGVDKLLVEDLPATVPVTRVVDPAQGVEIAQYVVAQTLAFTRDLPLYARQQAHAQWKRHPVRLASQCRVGVMGLGAVGQAIARAFAPLGYPVSGWSRSAKSLPGIQCHAGLDGLAKFLSHTDILVCALPLTPETRGLLNRGTLGQLPSGAFVVNVGRGEQLVEPDLQMLLDEGHLAGAALDVFDREPPPPDNWVWGHPKVSATPHIAAQASFDVVAAQCVDAWRSARAGDTPALAVDRTAGY
ncbi:2-hydroxyacid dehydrogenase [Piscinibacter gummiphilus]|uniref:Glyoxylate/hydroxypyruvate reductase A n=1 Tax=Piscinibacter gummiphilus TaxID=946333 RepID=A0A1W6L4K4_9BURK|nr:glyoxylate/hydroxypyruvate reductase A [Piscinibacter gummiphilus]ARN19245.1 glyoxylate/hydroxypyruvate reductase A [Piscinibacter gummiphilus]ATU63911.1 glyoxylate/hydroxypyruvate reductase A [Piscinibacter gummiphilus]GLS93141.1 glyoxylate/hydroxypyruvate reductase A [Piscinibacter gummiphilus]